MRFLLLLRRLRSLCIKELLIISQRIRPNRLVLIVPVVIQSFIFGYAATYDLNFVPYVVCDQSRSTLSRDLIARLDGSEKILPSGHARQHGRGRKNGSTTARRCSPCR